MRPARWVPTSLPVTDASGSPAAAMNTAAQPAFQLVRSVMCMKQSGIITSNTW
jgi:hypothetical protein